MASSMCGPSNALSSLHKHTIADRSLQQDRLQSPTPSSQLFRAPTTTTHTSNQRLESEFSQFSAGPLQGTHSQIHPLHHTRTDGWASDGWASDFQRLHVGAAGPAASLFQQHQQQPQGWAASNWHEEFLQPTHVAEPLLRGPGMGMYSGGFGQSFQMGGGMYMGGGIQADSTMQQNISERFDDAAFERAFEDARVQLEDSQRREAPAEVVEEKKEVKDKELDSDALARTAAQLLDSLSGNQSRKFQDSTFLALMRRLRDREVRVEGDKMVEVGSQ